MLNIGLPRQLTSKKSTSNAADPGSVPRWERSSGEGNANLLQYACLGIPCSEGPGRLASMVSQKNQTRLGDQTITTYIEYTHFIGSVSLVKSRLIHKSNQRHPLLIPTLVKSIEVWGGNDIFWYGFNKAKQTLNLAYGDCNTSSCFSAFLP